MGESYVIGPINSNQGFTLMTFQKYNSISVPCYLTINTSGATPQLLFDPTIQLAPSTNESLQNSQTDPKLYKFIQKNLSPGDTSSINLALLTAQQSGASFAIQTNDTNGDYIGAAATSNQAILTSTLTAVQPVNPNYNLWGVFLTGIPYSITGPNGSPLVWQMPTITSLSGDQQYNGPNDVVVDYSTLVNFSGGIYAIPSEIFVTGACTTGYNSINDVVTYDQAWNAGSVSGNTFFTTFQDCQNNYRYTYCPAGVNCGNTCKGPCPTGGTIVTQCLINQTTGNSYLCKPPPDTSPLWTRPIFWIALIVLIVVILLLIGLVIWRVNSTKPTAEKTSVS